MDSVEQDEIDMDPLFLGAIEDHVNQNKDFEVTITTKFGKIEAKIDSGVDVKAITEDDLKKIGKDRSMLKKTNKRLVGPDSQKIFCIGYTYLSLTWGILKMSMYSHGLPEFIVETDHKPLIPILNSRMLYDLSPRIQAMRMMLLKYSFTATHIPGKDVDA